MEKTKTVCIVGCGISGIHIANLLSHNGFNIIILEANNKIGGRIQDGKLLNKKINLGGELVHGKKIRLLQKCYKNTYQIT